MLLAKTECIYTSEKLYELMKSEVTRESSDGFANGLERKLIILSWYNYNKLQQMCLITT